MKLKIKYTSTKKFVLNFNGSTVDELLAAVIAFIADTYGDECDNIALSLNGQDPLPSGPNTSLSEAGVVASDLLTVIKGTNDPPLPPGGGGASAGGGGATSSGAGGGASAGGGGATSSGAGGGGATSSGAGGGASAGGGEKTPMAAAVTPGGGGGDQKPAVFLPSSLLDVHARHDSPEAAAVPESLSHALSQCRPKSQSQLVNLLSHITMVECGFVCPNSKSNNSKVQNPDSKVDNADSKVENPDLVENPDSKVKHADSSFSKVEQFVPPPGWDAMVANLSYTHKSYAGFTCTLVLVSMGDLKQILVSFPKQDVEISTKVSVNDYVEDRQFTEEHPVVVEDLRNVSKFAQKLRNELLMPLQLAAHRILGLPSPFHLAGLPSEILLLTLRLLDARSVLNVSQTCRRLHDASMDDALWQHLYRRDLGSPPSAMGDGPRWVTLYKERYQQRNSFNIGWQQPVPPDYIGIPQPRIYPTGPLHPNPPGFPYPPNPVGPYPVVPDPSQPFNPYRDPDSPYYGGDIPNHPPYPVYPGGPGVGPLGPDPLNPLGPDPLNPFGDPQFGGLGPGLPRRPQRPRGPGSGPDFRFI